MSMNQKAKHLTLEEREIIAQSLAEGLLFNEIAVLIKRHPSTVAREVMRHKDLVEKENQFLTAGSTIPVF